MSKGSKQRPLQVPIEKFSDNWDLIFNKKKQEQSSNNCVVCGEDHGNLPCPHLASTSNS